MSQPEKMTVTETAMRSTATQPSAYTRLMRLLDGHGARYRLIDHRPEGRTELVSALRGNKLETAAKCMVVVVRAGRERRYVLCVVPGDRRVDIAAVIRLYGGHNGCIAPVDTAERLTGSVSGSILPFSFHPDLSLVADPGVLRHEEMYFNARLDRSVAMPTADYVRICAPRVEPIAQPGGG
jgi:Ala-tRNA(Pro) deacylase